MEWVIEQDSWLTGVFGYGVFKLTLRSPRLHSAEAETSQLAEHVRARTAGFYYCRVGTDSIDAVRWLCASGFYVVDVNVTFRLPQAVLDSVLPFGSSPGVMICTVQPSHHEAVLRIAASCFRYSRFHLDPMIPQAVADRVKRRWIESYTRGERGEALYVALADGQVAGFLAVLGREVDGRPVKVIDLIGVDSAVQRRGIGRGLVRFFIDRYRECDQLQVGTQLANIPSLQLYQHLGFGIADAAYVLHRHVVDGARGD